MADYRVPHTRCRPTRFCAVRINSVHDSINVFGNYTEHGETPLMCTPTPSSCSLYVVIPEGSYAIVTAHGRSVGLWEPGFHWTSPWISVQFLVTKQSVVFDLPIKGCPTADNIFIGIDVSVVLRIRAGQQNVENFCYNTSPGQLNEQLDAALNERIRVLARSKTHLDAYAIKGKEHTEGMISFLNNLFSTKGIEIQSVIITNVLLPPDIAQTLEEKATYASKNALERKKQSYELRVINDNQEIDLLKQSKQVERQAEAENAKREQAEINKEHQKINAETNKLLAEIKEAQTAEVNRIGAEAQLLAQAIQSETKTISAKILAEGTAESEKLKAETDAYIKKKEAETELAVAKNKADALEYEGRIEAELSKLMSSKRQFDINMRKLGIMQSLSNNKNVTLFGNQNDNLLAQLAAFRITGKDLMN